MTCSHTHCVYVHACVHHQLKEELGTKADKETTIKSVTMLSKAVSALEAELQPTRDTVIRLAHEISDKQDAGSAERCGVTPRRRLGALVGSHVGAPHMQGARFAVEEREASESHRRPACGQGRAGYGPTYRRDAVFILQPRVAATTADRPDGGRGWRKD